MIQQIHSWEYVQKKIKILIQKDVCTLIFIAALITIAKILKQPKYTFSLSHTQWNIALPFAAMWMNIDKIMISETSETENDKYYMISLI